VGDPRRSGDDGRYFPGRSLFEHKSQAILARVNSTPHNSEANKFWMPINKSLKKRIQSSASNSIPGWRRAIFNKDSENFYFHRRLGIEQEVEEIKKIVVEMKETVSEKSTTANFPSEMDIKRHLDINRISDQVYQNIERRIRMERERRGL
jgi:hypothetical protein